ncbi:MAG: MFS transporter [Anaerolineaceae bacterium]|jgi:MFS family permease|nr:MAG: MFS transporter [Anaerolineaceae bacterium]
MTTASETLPTTEAAPIKGRWRNVVTLAFAGIVDAGEDQAMSSMFPAIRTSLNMTTAHLGTITSLGKVMEMIFGPLWGMLADRFSRKRILIIGTGLWGLWTLLIGFSASYEMLLSLRIIAAIGLVALGAPMNSMLADLFPQKERGKVFGVMRMISSLAVIVSILFFGRLAEIPEAGWRIGFITFGALSMLSGLLFAFFLTEPPRGSAEASIYDVAQQSEKKYAFSWQNVAAIFRVPTNLLLIFEKIFGVPVQITILTFAVTWLVDERGFRPGQATTVLTGIVIGSALSTLFGGLLGDWAERQNPRYGRLFIVQGSRAMMALLGYFLFQQMAGGMINFFAFALLFGLFMDMAFSGAIAPMIAAVNLPEQRSTAYAVNRLANGLIQAAVAALVGIVGDQITLTDLFFWTVTISLTLSVISWFAFYPFYHRDRMALNDLLTKRHQELTSA